MLKFNKRKYKEIVKGNGGIYRNFLPSSKHHNTNQYGWRYWGACKPLFDRDLKIGNNTSEFLGA